ncbi:MAG: DUF6320 domain-containing protein [Bacteroidales bacterium]|nr:DUF6320 domain-containing protein [Bacteroidales bacterium]
MNVCNYCGVELDVEMNYCPLCGHESNTPVVTGSKVTNKESKETRTKVYDFEELTQLQKRKIVWELAAIVLISGVVASFIIDLFINKQVTWSKYTITIGLVLLINTSLIIFMQRRFFLLLSGCFISTSLLLVLLDLFNLNLDWGLSLGIPIIFFLYIVLFFLSILIRKSRQKGINIIAYSLIAAGILCLCIEGIISLHLYNLLKFQWSVIVLVSVIPVSAILLYIHYRLKRVTNLKKFFHI